MVRPGWWKQRDALSPQKSDNWEIWENRSTYCLLIGNGGSLGMLWSQFQSVFGEEEAFSYPNQGMK